MFNKKIQQLALSSLFISSFCFSQSASEEIVVVASRIAQPQKFVGQSVSVLNREQIENRGQLSLVDVLRQVPGVSVTRNGGVGSVSTLRIRGEEGYRTLTLVDG